MDRLSDYRYDLPEALIAQDPLEPRDESRLLHLHRDSGEVEHRRFADTVELLLPGDLLVVNNTRVSAKRIFGRKATGGAVEALLMRELQPGSYEALVKPGKSLRPGTMIEFDGLPRAEVASDLGDGLKQIVFADADVADTLESVGQVPLPPYITHRLAESERYQTVYGTLPGSAAAPTAGLHFTPRIFARLRERGVEVAQVTLHVGIDTFRPVQVENLDDHRMHGELCEVPSATADAIHRARGRIVAVGTTTVRTLETFAVGKRRLESGQRESRLFIREGFDFQIIDGMFTNFHLPETTMLVMISALAGREPVLHAYREAVTNGYRFLSFGDSMLIL